MAKAEASVEELVSMIERGELRLPEMQRQYVWRSTRVRDLLDSLYRGYPSGAILLWETDEAVPLQDFAVSQSTNPYQSTRLLLDGQQRLTSLSAVIRGEPVSVRGRRRPIDLLFNLEHPDQLAVVTEVEENGDGEDDVDDDSELIGDETDSTEDELLKRFNKMTFVVATRKLEQLPHWVKVSEVFKTDNDAPFLKRAGISGFDDSRYESTASAWPGYVASASTFIGWTCWNGRFPTMRSRKSSSGSIHWEPSCAVPTWLWRRSPPSGGTRCRRSRIFRGPVPRRALTLTSVCAKNLMAFATGQSRFQIVGSLNVEKLQKAWKEACDGMEFGLNFLRSNLGIDSPALLSSPFLLVVLAYFGHSRNYALSNHEARQLRYWALMANAKGRFSRGSSETILDQDLANIRQGGAVSELIDRLRLQFGRLDITAEELEGRNQRSALFKTMFLAFRAAGAKDWRSHLTISLDHSGAQHRLQFHHIFPKAVLKTSFTAREADDIANLAFIGGKTNRAISDKARQFTCPPLVDQLGEPAFAAQCIPVEASLLEVESYKAFLASDVRGSQRR